MQTFKQFIEAREIRDIPQNDIREILRHIDNPIISVKFALYCAEDCFHLNDEITKPAAQRCIDLVRKWLINPKSVTAQELVEAYSYANTHVAVSWNDEATYSAASAATTVAHTISHDSSASNAAIYSAYVFASSKCELYSYDWSQVYTQKIEEYKRKLKGMTTTRTNYTKHSEMLKGYDNTELAIRLALDELEEIDEIGREHFVYQDDDGQWVFDLGHDNILRAASKEALATLIHNDRYYLNALLRIYNANV